MAAYLVWLYNEGFINTKLWAYSVNMYFTAALPEIGTLNVVSFEKAYSTGLNYSWSRLAMFDIFALYNSLFNITTF